MKRNSIIIMTDMTYPTFWYTPKSVSGSCCNLSMAAKLTNCNVPVIATNIEMIKPRSIDNPVVFKKA